MAFDTLGLTPGIGFNLAVDTFTDADAVVRGMPYGAVAFGPIDGPYTGVVLTNGLPVQPQTGATFPVSAASLPLPTGAALDATLTGGTQVAKAVGDVAAGSADSGAPVKIGGQCANGPPSAATAGNRVNGYFDPRGRLAVLIGQSGVDVSAVNINDGVGSGGALCVASYPLLYNPAGTAFDRQRGNNEVTVLASAARTTAQTPSDLTNHNARGVVLTIDVTAASGTGGLTVTIKGKSTLSGKYNTILASTTLTAIGTTVLKVYPGLTAAANAAANDVLPRVWQVTVTVGDASSYTYSIDANYIL